MMQTHMQILLSLIFVLLAAPAPAAEERIRGLLEKTAKAGACAQIADALNEIYYVNKSDEAEKAVANYVGKNTRVVVTGTVEARGTDYFLNVKSVDPYVPKTPPAPPPAAIILPPVDSKK